MSTLSGIERFSPQALPNAICGLSPLQVRWPKQRRKEAAVGVLFIPSPDGPDQPACIVLTRRSTKLSSHRGQVAFAGGMADVDDVGPEDTVLRELEEELGIARRAFTVLGQLPAISALTGAPVLPVVACANVGIDEFNLNLDEVERLFFVPWPILAQDKCKSFQFNVFGMWRHSFLFQAPECVVWGLTANILAAAAFR